jgi:hypothetical protein
MSIYNNLEKPMTKRITNDGKTETWHGNVTVEGVSCDVVLEVNIVDLILQLGTKAANSSIGLAREAGGLVKVTVNAGQRREVKRLLNLRKVAEEAARHPYGYAIIQPHQGDEVAHCVAIYPSRGKALAMKCMEKCQYVRGATLEEYEARKATVNG